MVAGLRLRSSGGSFAAHLTLSAAKFVGNPVIDVDDNPNETFEQYVPAPIILPNGDIWVYVKGTGRIYAWRSTDGGETFTLENSNNPVIAPTHPTVSWEQRWATEPFAVYDEPTDTIHIYYKGTNAADENSNWAWGHATAPGSDPTDVTKDPANPIFTSSDLSSALGGTIHDLAISDVFIVGSTYWFYGYALFNSRYKMIRCSGTTWTDPDDPEVVVDPGSDALITYKPSVFRFPGHARYGMLYTQGDLDLDPSRIRVAISDDDTVTWDFSDTTNLLTTGAGGSWDSLWMYACALLRRPYAPYTAPVVDDFGRWLLYFSGYDGTDANSGLAYVTLG